MIEGTPHTVGGWYYRGRFTWMTGRSIALTIIKKEMKTMQAANFCVHN